MKGEAGVQAGEVTAQGGILGLESSFLADASYLVETYQGEGVLGFDILSCTSRWFTYTVCWLWEEGNSL